MAENPYYEDGAPAAEPAEREATRGEVETTLIPKSMCPGMEVGDSIELRIVRSHDREYEVAYEEGEKEGEEMGGEEEMEAPPMEGPPAEAGGMAAMMG